MSESRPAFYALAPGGWRDWWTLLHPPYTLWHLSYVAIGAATAAEVDLYRLGMSLLGFFLGVGLAAHALDELRGRPLRTSISDRMLQGLALVSLAGAAAVGVVGIVQVSAWLAVFIAAGSVPRRRLQPRAPGRQVPFRPVVRGRVGRIPRADRSVRAGREAGARGRSHRRRLRGDQRGSACPVDSRPPPPAQGRDRRGNDDAARRHDGADRGRGHQVGAGDRAEAPGPRDAPPRDGARDLEALAGASPCRVRSIRAVSALHRVIGFAVVAIFALGWIWGLGAKIARRQPGDGFWTWLTVAQVTAGAQALLGTILLLIGPPTRSGWSLRGHPPLRLRLSAFAALRVRTRGCEDGHARAIGIDRPIRRWVPFRVGFVHQLRAHASGVDDRARLLAATPALLRDDGVRAWMEEDALVGCDPAGVRRCRRVRCVTFRNPFPPACATPGLPRESPSPSPSNARPRPLVAHDVQPDQAHVPRGRFLHERLAPARRDPSSRSPVSVEGRGVARLQPGCEVRLPLGAGPGSPGRRPDRRHAATASELDLRFQDGAGSRWVAGPRRLPEDADHAPVLDPGASRRRSEQAEADRGSRGRDLRVRHDDPASSR